MARIPELDFKIVKAAHLQEDLSMEMILLYIVDGKARISVGGNRMNFGENGILLIEPGFPYEIDSAGKNEVTIAEARYSPELFSRATGSENILLCCNSETDRIHSYEDLRTIFCELIRYWIHRRNSMSCLTASVLLKLLDCLLENHATHEEGDAPERRSEDFRTREIIRYVLENYRSEISLSSLAETMYVSTSTLSRIYKKHTGIYFADFVDQVRLHSAMLQLMYTDSSLTRIALENGFSGASVFSRKFRMAYGCSPSDYRSRHRDAAETEQHRKEQQDNALLQELAERPAFTGSGDEARELPEQRVTAEGPEERQEVLFSGKDGGKPFTQKWDEVINIGSFHDATLANIQYHILYLQENLHFRYVRLWNVFSRKLQITDENAAGTYNFSMVDQVLDFFTEHHLNVYLDIGRRPDTIVRSGSEIVHKEEEYIVFEDRGSWEDMLRSFIQHIIRRYGREVVSGWIFEASRDGIHDSEEACYYFDGGKPGEYAAAYGFFCRLMREELPEARIAAIGAVIYWDWDYLRCFLEQCRQDKLLPDYVSIILYPYRPYREGKTVSKWIAADAGSEREQVGMIHELLDNVGIPDMKVCVSEWNHTISDRNILNDSSFRAAYFAEKLGETRDSVDLVCIMTGSDWISSYADFCGIADGGIGLLTKDTIGKPGFFALQLMEHMGDNVILEKEHVLITRKKDRDYFILCSNLKWFSQRYFLSGENIRLEDDPLNIPGEVFSDLKPLKITFTVADMEAGREYNVRKRRIRDGEGSILGEWKKLGYDRELTSQDIRYLRTSCYPRMELVRQTADPEKGVLSVSVTLDANEVVLIHIY